MTDVELVTQMLSSLGDHVARVVRRRPPNLAAFRADEDIQDALSMSLLVATQTAIDIAFHIAADESWGVPSSNAEAFDLLSRHGVIPASLASRVAGVVAVRNRIAHIYGTVDLDRLWNEVPAGVDALQQFARAIATFLASRPA